MLACPPVATQLPGPVFCSSDSSCHTAENTVPPKSHLALFQVDLTSEKRRGEDRVTRLEAELESVKEQLQEQLQDKVQPSKKSRAWSQLKTLAGCACTVEPAQDSGRLCLHGGASSRLWPAVPARWCQLRTLRQAGYCRPLYHREVSSIPIKKLQLNFGLELKKLRDEFY